MEHTAAGRIALTIFNQVYVWSVAFSRLLLAKCFGEKQVTAYPWLEHELLTLSGRGNSAQEQTKGPTELCEGRGPLMFRGQYLWHCASLRNWVVLVLSTTQMPVFLNTTLILRACPVYLHFLLSFSNDVESKHACFVFWGHVLLSDTCSSCMKSVANVNFFPPPCFPSCIKRSLFSLKMVVSVFVFFFLLLHGHFLSLCAM